MTHIKTTNIPRRLLALLLSVAFLMGFATPVMAAPATIAGTTTESPIPYPDLQISHTSVGANGEFDWGHTNSEKTDWEVTVQGGSRSYAPTLLFYNNGEETKTLSFDLTAVFGADENSSSKVTVNTGRSGGTELYSTNVTVTGVHITNENLETDGLTVAPGGYIRVTATSRRNAAAPLTVTLTNLRFVADNSADTTFLPADNGSYTVDGVEITKETTYTKDSSETYSLAAIPADGYRFYAWYESNTDRILSTATPVDLSFDNDSVVTALFVPDVTEENGVYGVELEIGTVPFVDFDDAADFALAMHRSQVTLLKDYTLTGSIAIPDGVTLLIPFDDAHTLYTDAPEIDTYISSEGTTKPSAHVTPSAYRTLTMAPGSSIIIENGGGLSLSSKISATGTGANSYNGTPTGPDGRILMQGDSAIEVENGGSLYAYGYIYGSGSVHANDGATVFECFQIRNWRGGTATANLMDTDVFPISMYYVQNIEVPLTLDAGATEIARSGISAAGLIVGAGVTFIGEGGMFRVSEGFVVKEYVPATDRLEITLDGDASVTSIQLVIPEAQQFFPDGINSANFVLPINNNITVNCASGSEVMISQDMALLPGSVMNISEGVTVTFAQDTEVYVYDRDEYVGKGFVSNSTTNFVPVGYTASNGTANIRTDADLMDAKVNVNGTIVVNGGFYTTESGAAIVSEGKTGKVVFTNGAGTESVTQMTTQTSTAGGDVITEPQNIAIYSAWLQHGDGTYLETSLAERDDVYNYSAEEDKWIEPFHGIIVSFDPNGGDGEMDSIQIPYAQAEDGITLPENGFTREGYDFVGWSEFEDCEPDEVVLYPEDTLYPADFSTNRIVMYAIWEKQPTYYTVTFNANGGEGTMEPQRFLEGEEQALSLNAFTREGYDFLGWAESADGEVAFSDGEVTTIEENLNLYAVWQKNFYTVTYHSNFDPDAIVTQNVPLEQNATILPNTFSREGYEFIGWADEPTDTSSDFNVGASIGFDGDTDLYAVWEKNSFTITFVPNGGVGDPYTQTIVRDVSTPLIPNTFTREGYDFIGWSTEPNGQIWFTDGASITTDSVEDFTLYAQWQIREYTITFKNWDYTLLVSFTIEHGEVPSYTGPEFGRDADAQYTYTFEGWSDGENTYTGELPAATANVIYTATYTRTGNMYDVAITCNGQGTVSVSPELVNGQAAYGTELTLTAAATGTGWVFTNWTDNNGTVVSDANPYVITVGSDVTLTANFEPDPDAVAKIDDKYYTTLYAAEADSVSGDTIVLLKPFTQRDDITIRAGRTLLLPYEADAETVNPDIDLSGLNIDPNNLNIMVLMQLIGRLDHHPFANEEHSSTAVGITPIGEQVHVKLTLADNVKLTVEDGASLVVGGKMTGNQPVTGTVYGSHSEIELNDGAEIVVEHGAMLSNCGYIYGDGQITAHGLVYEPFIITDYHGGNALLNRVNNKFTPFNSFALLDIQCDLVIHSDGALKGYAMVNQGTTQVCASALVVGELDDEIGMFVLDDEATLTISYNAEEVTDTYGIAVGKSTFTANGNIEFRPFSLSLGFALPTDEITFGIPYNMDLVQESGCFTISAKAAVLAGSTVTVKEGASAVVTDGSVLLVLDYFNPGNEGSKSTYPDSERMKRGNLFIDGTLTIKEGATFGGVVQTNGYTGKVIVEDGAILAGTFKTVDGSEANGNSYYVEARIAVPEDADEDGVYNSIYLMVDIGAAEYRAVSGIEVEDYDGNDAAATHGLWTYDVTVTFKPNSAEATGTTANITATIGSATTMPQCGFTREGYIFMGWNTMANGNGTSYAAGASITFYPDTATVYFAQWAPDGWVNDGTGLLYYQNGEPLKTGWTELDGKWYYFDTETGYAATGIKMVPYAPAETGHEYGPYEVDLNPASGHPEYAELGYATNGEFVFDENGVFQLNQTGKIMKNGSEWWCQNGEVLWHARLVTDGEYYYYGSAGGALKRSVTDYIGDTNGLLPAGTYTFDDEGRIIMYNGIITIEGGKWYYEQGRRTFKGLFEYPEGSNVYYYAASDGRIICDQDYYVTKTNDLFEQGIYTFDEEGHMILNGLYWQEGKLWYYENGVKTYAGLIKVGEDYYYIRNNGAAVLNADYYVSKTNDLMPKGVYHFGPDGKMVIPETTIKNGLYWEDGKLWYYVDGVKTHAGLICVDGYYYYIKSNGQAVTDCNYFVSNTNDLMPRATHHFDENGRMTDVPSEKNGLVLEADGRYWYYENGQVAHPGLIQIGDNYYYICTTGFAVADCDYYISNTNGLMPKGTYHFNADATMVIP